MPSIVEVGDRQRAALAAGGKVEAERLARAYARVDLAVQRDLDRLTKRIADARAAGEDLGPSWLPRQAQFRAYQASLARELTKLAPLVADSTDTLVRDAVERATEDAAALAATAGVATESPLTFGGLNARAVEEIVAQTAEGPLAELIADRVPTFAALSTDILQEAVARGWSPARTARELRRVSGGAFANALTVASTEQFRAYRETTRLSYLENPAVDEWVWSSRRTKRTCAFCWALHGTRHSTSERMATHPRCGCTMLPFVPDVDYGDPGEALFARLTDEEQRDILGPGKFDAYKAGEIGLEDLIEQGIHPKWGPVGRERSLRDALAGKSPAPVAPVVSFPSLASDPFEDRYPEEVAALPRKAAPTGIVEDIRSTNPYYGTHPDYGLNCQRVVVAYDLRRRGFDVDALPRPDDPFEWRDSDSDIAENWMDDDGEFREPTYGRPEDIEANIAAQPPGARGVLFIAWRTGGGHVFNYEKLPDGRTVWVEAQEGELLTDDEAGKVLRRYRAKGPEDLGVLRVDDLTPSWQSADAVARSGDKPTVIGD